MTTSTAGERRELRIHSPATGEVVGTAPILGAEAVRECVARARAAQPDWAALGPRRRGRVLLGFRDLLAGRADEVAELSSRETGKLPIEALTLDVLTTCDLARWYARRAPEVLARRRIPPGWMLTKRCYQVWEPYGVIAVIGPWNLPVLNTMRTTLAALAAGNSVLLKPSEYAPLSALLVRELAVAAGVPADVFQVVTGDGSTGAAVIDAGVDKISFTGSVATGRAVAKRAAEGPIPVTLELGGNDPMIVLADADVDRAVRAAAAGAFWNAGQICVSVERAYVEAPIYDRFVERLATLAKELRVGPARDGDIGALTTDAQLATVERHIRDAVDRGARIAAGGSRVPGPGRYFEPTVLADADHTMAVMREETFGPVIPVMKVRDTDEAIRLANDSPYALGANLWAGPERAERLASRLRAGMININEVLATGLVAGLPFGGRGGSGYGATYGDAGLRDMSRTRSVLVDRLGWRREFGYYPLRRFGEARVRALIRLLHGPGTADRLRGLLGLVTGRPG